MKHYKNADLHCHSLVSDGSFSPTDVAKRAHANGVDLWALTDHDELSGQKEARDAALSLGMDYLCGVEISITFIDRPIHIVALGVDPENQVLVEGLRKTRSGRLARAQAMAQSLAQVGIPHALEGALKYVSNPDLISRTHFAKFLVAEGYCSSHAGVFEKYLVKGRPGYAEHRWATLREAITWAKEAGGLCTIAHPARYNLSANEEYALLNEFVGLGGAGIEAYSGSHTQAECDRYLDVAKEFGLAVSRGCDFHGTVDSHIEFGKVAQPPGDIKTMWSLLASRICRAS